MEYADGESVIEPTRDVTGIVLAGGRARRMGGLDKGLLEIAGAPMIAHVLERLAPQVSAVLISANRNLDDYRVFGYPVLPDVHPDYPGPLAGLAAGLRAAETPFVLAVPCDSPLTSRDLAARLCASAGEHSADIAVAHDGDRLQPTFALIRRSLVESLESYIAAGERKIDRWYARHVTVTVDCSDMASSFANVNDPEQRAAIEKKIMRSG
jgi:molybdopterin-guanine dinucleotide biosynthesis protein A